MELLLLLLLVPIIKLVLLPARVAGRVRRLPFAEIGLIAALVLAGWFGLQAMRGPATATAGYERGDTQLRALLE